MTTDTILHASATPIAILTEESLVSSSIFRFNNVTPDKQSSGSQYCRICHEDSTDEQLIDPCECSGTLALIHASCLEKWLSTSNTERCEICKYVYTVKRKKKTIVKSVRQWWKSRNAHEAHSIAGDAISLIVLTPLCIAATYLCSIGASDYARLGFWESTGLAILSCMLVATYCLWLIITVRFHFKSWGEWRRRNQEVKLLVKRRTNEKKNGKVRKDKVLNEMSEGRSNNESYSSYGRTNRIASWLGLYFETPSDTFFALQQTTLV